MQHEGKIWAGTSATGPVYLLPQMANRHGLIAGATGTGKTVSLKVLAEGFSEMGVPVFLSDIKGDLSGMIREGSRSEALDKRLASCGADPETFSYHSFPAMFWDVYGEQGLPIRATVEDMGPLLLSRMLGLNETQSGVMNILFRVGRDQGLALDDLKDLKAMLAYVGEHAKEYTLNYGNVSMASIGAIQRAVAVLEDQGGDTFFGKPALNIADWMAVEEETGRGCINILAADRLFNNPAMYSTFLLWMLTKLYDLLPERGDADKPRIVFFFDEAHLLFNNCGRALMEKIEQVVRLIRSKGVGVYFITQSPADIPMTILGQLGNRVQHALRAYTPLDQKAVKVAAQTFRTNPSFDTEEAITLLKTGEALISFLDEHGAPGVVERATILPPQSFMGAISQEEREQIITESPLKARYDRVINEISAWERLNPAPAQITFPFSFTTPFAAQVSTAQTNMAQTFKVYDPTTGQYVAQENPNMTPVEPAPSIQQPVMQQPAPEAPAMQPQMMQQAYQQPVYQQPTADVPVMQPQMAAQPMMPQGMVPQQPLQGIVQPNQTVPTIQVQPQVQTMPVMVLDPTTGQYVQQMMTMQLDPSTGNYIPVQQAQIPQIVVDPKTAAEQQKAAEKAAKEAAREEREREAAERRARTDALREEAAERARRNDSVAGRVKNTAISTATRQVVSSLTKGLTKAVTDLLGGNKK